MAQQCEVLLIEDTSTPSAWFLGHRLCSMGFRTAQARNSDELTRLMDRPDLPFRAAMVSTSVPSERLSQFVAPLRQHLVAGEVTGLAVGRAPAPEIRNRLREMGFTLALWHPCDDHTLRFQVNQAVARARGEKAARAELRAPLAWQVSVHAGGRHKKAQVYNLSKRGAFLETARPSMVGAEINVELPLPNGRTPLPASVVHTNVPGNLLSPCVPIGMGIRFTDPSPTVTDDLARIVEERSLNLLV